MTINLYQPEKNGTRFLLILTLFMILGPLKAQFFSSGTEPTSVKWKRIETAHFIVIYPEDAEWKAQEYASKLEQSYEYVSYSVGFQPKKYAYVLHNYSAISNGLTAVAPNRVELWAKPHQDIYGQAWEEQLVIHEGRHMVQFMSMYRGASKLPIWLTGQMGYSFPIGLYIPTWYMEGDAVVAETALSHFGRGRLPGFEKGMRAYFLQKKNPGYDKMMLGSYQDFIPNHYETGYQIIAANRVFRDKDIFKDKMESIARYPWWIWPFSRRSNGLKDTRRFKYYRFAADTLMKLWKEQDLMVGAGKPEIMYQEKDFTGLEVIRSSGDAIYAMQRDYDYTPRIVKLNGAEKLVKVVPLGYSSGKYFDVKGDKIALTLEIPNPRWEQASNMCLFTYNMGTGEYQQLTTKQSYYAPVLHPTKNQVAVVEMSNSNICRIAILDAENGKVINYLPNPDNSYIITPCWSEDGSKLVYIRVTDKGKVLCVSDLKNEKVIFGPVAVDFRHPVVKADTVYFSGDWSGIENIYALPVEGGEPNRITNSRFGAVSPVFDSKGMVYLDYSWRGNFIARDNAGSGLCEPLSLNKNFAANLSEKLAEQEPGVIEFSETDKTLASSKHYSKFLHQFNFHSWIPVASFKLDEPAYVPGVSVVSQSLLNDATIAVGYNYMEEIRDEKFYVNYTYRGFLPVIHLNAYWGDKEHKQLLPADYGDYNYYSDYGYGGSGDLEDYYMRPHSNLIWNNYRLESKLELPLTKRIFDLTLVLTPYVYGSTGAIYATNTVNNVTSKRYSNQYWGAGLSHYLLKQKAYRDLYSPFGYSFKYNYQYYDTKVESGSNAPAIKTQGGSFDLFLPGVAKHHSLLLHSSFLKLNRGSAANTVFSQPVSMPVGWNTLTEMSYGHRNYRLGAEYYFPLGNLDAEIFWLFYLKRLNLGLWADYGRFEKDLPALPVSVKEYNIVGGTFFFDMHFFRYPVEFKVGAKAGYSFSSEQPYINIILNIGDLF